MGYTGPKGLFAARGTLLQPLQPSGELFGLFFKKLKKNQENLPFILKIIIQGTLLNRDFPADITDGYRMISPVRK